MKVIRLYNRAASKEPLAVSTWNGENDSLPPDAPIIGEGGCIEYACIQGDCAALSFVLVGEEGSGRPIEVKKTELTSGEFVQFASIRMPQAFCEASGVFETILQKMPKMKVNGEVNIVRGGAVVYGE